MTPNEEKGVVTQQPGDPGVTPTNTPKADPVDPKANQDPEKKDPATPQKPERKYSKEEVTTILKKRLERFQAGFFQKYGVKNSQELDALYEKHKDYDALVTERDGLKESHAQMSEKVAFLENNVDPNRYDDIRTHFKGLGQSFDSAILGEMIKTHPEWVKKSATNVQQTTIKQVGSPKTTSPTESAEAKEERIFGKI
jgi:hypothetical protein